jgi:hypothetical protein
MDRRVKAGAVRPAQAFPEIYRIRRYLEPPEAGAFLSDGLAKFTASHWPKPVTRRSRWLAEQLDLSRYVPLKTVARELKRSNAALAELAERHGVPVIVLGDRSRRPQRYFERDQVELVEIAASEEVSVREAAVMLGVTRERMRQLMSAGIVPIAHKQRRGQWAAHGPLEALAEALFERAGPTACDVPANWIPLNRVLHRYVTMAQCPAFFRALVEGDVSVKRRGASQRLCQDLLICREEAAAWPPTPMPTGLMSAPAAAKALGVNQETLYELIKVKLISADHAPGPRRQQTLVSAQALEDFRRRFVSATELASRWRTSPAAVARRLHDHGIKPSGPRRLRKLYFSRAAADGVGARRTSRSARVLTRASRRTEAASPDRAARA